MCDASGAGQPERLVGAWRKISTEPCADKYPATITFSTSTYLGTRTPDQGLISWDAGIYRLQGHAALVISTATDELVTYELTVHDDRFEVTDADGCHLTYQRMPSGG